MATYKIKGDRFVRMYKASITTPAYSAPLDAATIVEELCNCEWTPTAVRNGGFPAHSGSEKTDQQNVASRELFDAYEFCAEHKDGMHRAYAGACFYRFRLPPAAVGMSLVSIKASVSCDPYNAYGARLSVNTGSSAILPTQCATCRNGASADTSAAAQTNNAADDAPATEWTSTNTHVEGVAPRREAATGSTTTWYPNSGTAVIAPAGGLELERYLYVFVGLENYNYARQGYLEGSASVSPTMEIVLSGAISGIADGSTVDCASGEGVERVIVTHLPESSLYVGSAVQTGQFCRVFATQGKICAIGPSTTNAVVFPGMTVFYAANSLVAASMDSTVTAEDGNTYFRSQPVKDLALAADVTGVYLSPEISVSSNGSTKYFSQVYVSTHSATTFLGQLNRTSPTSSSYSFYPYNMLGEDFGLYDADADGGDLLVVKNVGEGRGLMLPVTLGASSLTVPKLGELAIDGVATGVGQYVATDSGRFCLAGDFRSVGGVPVRNCCVVDMRSGGFRVIPINFDAQVTPDGYDGFRLVATSANSYHFAGGFTRLGAADCPTGSAAVTAQGAITADDAHYIDVAAAGSNMYKILANVTTM